MTDYAAQIIFTDAETALRSAERPFFIGVAGAQGSGKSTVANKLAAAFSAQGRRVAILSLDDLYLDHEARLRLAHDIHPLFATRGVPGTHDVDRGLEILRALRDGRNVNIPRFDKGSDSRAPEIEWTRIDAAVDIVVIEGWCLGAAPQDETALAEPVNELERSEDAGGRWRHYVNEALAGPYQSLFAFVDRLYFLRAPSFEIVRRWRGEQERTPAATAPADRRAHLMSEKDIAHFIAHYERITRHMLEELVNRADVTLQLDETRRVTAIMARAD